MSTTTPNDNKQTGRTISDLLAEYPKIALTVVLIIGMILGLAIMRGYTMKSPFISFEKNPEQNLPTKDSTKSNIPKDNASDEQPSEKTYVTHLPKKPKEQLKQPVIASTNLGNTINVTSHNQKGGITANQVNIGSIPRRIDANSGKPLLEFLNNKNEYIHVSSIQGDTEASQFAFIIAKFLKANGYKKIDLGGQFIYEGVLKGTTIERDTTAKDSTKVNIFVGSNIVD